MAANTGVIVTCEDHNVRNGISSIVGTYIAENGIHCRFQRMGIHTYGVSGNPEFQYRYQSMHEDDFAEMILRLLKNS
jgi:transketolase